MKKRIKVLITGAGKFTHSWCNITHTKFENIIISKSNRKNYFPNTNFKVLDMRRYEDIRQSIKECSPDIIINSAAITDVNYCEVNPLECKEVNTSSALHLADIANAEKIKFIQISTDHFESHPLEIRDEYVNPIPINQYGSSKVNVDQNLSGDNIIVRTNFFDTTPLGFQNSFMDLCKTLNLQKTYFGIDDICFTPIATQNLVKILSELIDINFTGVLNVSGNECISKYLFAVLVAKKLKISDKHIKKVNYDFFKHQVKRPNNMCLNNAKLLNLLPNSNVDLKSNINLALS
jgi:dTDP-4-dehydrorhamnose reductase